MNQEQSDKILREQAERKRIREERESLVEKVGEAIQLGIATEVSHDKMREEASKLLRIVEQVILNTQRGRDSRHQYADGHGSLAGVSLSLEDIDLALDVVRKIRGI